MTCDEGWPASEPVARVEGDRLQRLCVKDSQDLQDPFGGCRHRAYRQLGGGERLVRMGQQGSPSGRKLDMSCVPHKQGGTELAL